MSETARARMIEAAFALFAERGYEQTTVDDIAERAGVSRMSFFRAFGSKEGVIFPDHDDLLASLRDRFEASTSGAQEVAIVEAARLVLQHYLDEGDLARRRYALTRSVPALRDREMAGIRQYQQLFRDFVIRAGTMTPLDAELLASAVVTAHNAVLRAWLRGESDDPLAEFDAAMARVLSLFRMDDPRGEGHAPGAVIVVRTDRDLAEALPQLRRLLA